MRFSIEAKDRPGALTLQGQLTDFAPWLIEVAHGSFLVQGTIVPARVDDLRSLVETWGREHECDPCLVFLDMDGNEVVH